MHLLAVVHVFQCCLLTVYSCPSLCACIYGGNGTGGVRSMLCSDRRISVVPVYAPANMVKLRLERTSIARVPRAAFYNLAQLQFLWLTYNSIRTVHPSSFVNLRALRELRLDGNLLSAFPWEGLRDMPQLRTLGLHNNRLSSLPPHAALFLLNVTYLDLSSNRLAILPAELLDLWFPLPELQGGPVQRRVLGLHDNPWLCDCQISLAMSLSMSLGSPVVLIDQFLTCTRTPGQPGAVLTQADLSPCMRPSVQPRATRVTSPLGSNVILRCDATGYPTPTLTWIKTSVYRKCCQQADIPADPEPLPRNLESFLQESPRVGVRWSIISLNGLSYKDAGEYRCLARNMAGAAEAPIKLQVVGLFGGGPRRPKSKSPKTPPKPSLNYKEEIPLQKPNGTLTQNSPSGKKSQVLKKGNPPTLSNNTVSTVSTNVGTNFSSPMAPEKKLFPVKKFGKKRKMNKLTGPKRKPKMSVKTTSALPETSSSLLSSEAIV